MEKMIYYTLNSPSDGEVFKDKKSKFYGFAFPVKSLPEIKARLLAIKQEHNSSRHVCYGWKLGLTEVEQKASDDGEPHHSAGSPILGQITAFDLTDVLVVVVRYYGGKKLGVSGLINAYRTAARSALEQAVIVRKELYSTFKLKCSYNLMYLIMQTVKKYRWDIRKQQINENCIFLIDVRQSEKDAFIKTFTPLKGISFQVVSSD